MEKRLEDKVAVVTGANSGIGLETARMLAAEGASVVLGCRNQARGEEAVAKVVESTGNERATMLQLDLASKASIEAATARVLETHPAVHILVNNAGLILSERRQTQDGFEQTFGVNHLGHFLFTDGLLSRMKENAPSRIVNVASEAYRIASGGLDMDDLQFKQRGYSGFRAYGASKLANILYTQALARRLEGTGVVVHSLHPGTIRSGFGKDGDTRGPYRVLSWLFGPLLKGPRAGAKVALHCAISDKAGETSGEYWVSSKIKTPKLKPYARDEEAAEALWRTSVQLWSEAGATIQHRD